MIFLIDLFLVGASIKYSLIHKGLYQPVELRRGIKEHEESKTYASVLRKEKIRCADRLLRG